MEKYSQLTNIEHCNIFNGILPVVFSHLYKHTLLLLQ